MPSPLAQAVRLLQAGELVAFPTETVYGLGADAANPDAVAKIFAAKGRPADHPVIVHLPCSQAMENWAQDIPAMAWELAEYFWPGPLTLILKRQPWVPDAVTGGQNTVGLRVPGHPVALALLRAFAAAQSWEEDAQTTRDAAVRRLGEDLLEAAWAATEALYTGSIARSRTPGRRVIAVSGAEGSAWLRGELGRLVAVSRALAPWAPGFAVDLADTAMTESVTSFIAADGLDDDAQRNLVEPRLAHRHPLPGPFPRQHRLTPRRRQGPADQGNHLLGSSSGRAQAARTGRETQRKAQFW